MKINKIHIISFGGLKDKELDFSDGLNCIYGENEQGKTTIMSFIKMMFYGSTYSGQLLSNNLRKKYTPWDGSQMAGIIEFENDGKLYKLEREFKKSNSTDKVSLTDMSLGEKVSAESDIGNRLFGLSSAAFERSIFIGQLGFPDSDIGAESELNARLSNMVSTGDEKVSLEQVSARLEKPRYALISKSGKAGEYYKGSVLAKELEAKLQTSVNANNRYSEGKKALLSHIEETKRLSQELKILKAELSKENDVKNARKLAEFVEAKENLEDIKAELTLSDGTPADESFLRGIKFYLSKLEGIKTKAEAKKNEADFIKNQLDTLLNGAKLSTDETPEKLTADLEVLDSNLVSLNNKKNETKQKIDELTDISQNTKPSFNPTLLILGLCSLAICGFMFFISPISTIPFTALGIIFIVLSFVLKSNKKSELIKAELEHLQNVLDSQTTHAEDLKSQIGDKKTKLEAIRLANTSNAEVIESQRSKLVLCENELNVLIQEQNSLKLEFESLIGKLSKQSTSIEETIALLETAAVKQKELKNQISFLLRDLNNITYEEAKVKLSKIDTTLENGEDFEGIRIKFEALQKQITERNRKEDIAATELKAMLSGIENPDVLKAKLYELKAALYSKKDFCDSVDIALETLKESFAELRSGYGSALEKESAEIFARLTKGKYRNMTVSKSFGLNVEEQSNPISREAEYLSSGTFDQAYLSVRLAVAKLLGENLPLFLDDTLTQYDDTRAKATLEFLKDYLEDNQAIMFTCHKSILNLAESLDCKIKML
ncbi:MAG: AAA family ATPase [Clostridia bacterium]|nr:AAA family ATPase [Clostridia bacterium]